VRPSPSLFRHVLDACALTDIERDNKMAALRRRCDEVVIPDKVAKEVGQPGTALRRFLESHHDVVIRLSDSEGEEYLKLRREPGIDDADACAIAIAYKRGLPLVTGDGCASRIAGGLGVKTMDWRSFIRK